jgi:hypothetical protein
MTGAGQGQWKVSTRVSTAVDAKTSEPQVSYSYFESREEALKFACERQPPHHKAILIEGPRGVSMGEHEIELQCRDIHR